MSPGQLVDLLAQTLGVPRESIVVVDRELAKAGLRTMGGRGRSAAKVTAHDAATLLLATLASPVLTRADKSVLLWQSGVVTGLKQDVPEDVRHLMPESFREPLVQSLERIIVSPPALLARVHVVLDLSVDWMLATLRFEVGAKENQKYKVLYLVVTEQEMKRPEGDLARSSQITRTTFQALHNALFNEAAEGAESDG